MCQNVPEMCAFVEGVGGRGGGARDGCCQGVAHGVRRFKQGKLMFQPKERNAPWSDRPGSCTDQQPRKRVFRPLVGTTMGTDLLTQRGQGDDASIPSPIRKRADAEIGEYRSSLDEHISGLQNRARGLH